MLKETHERLVTALHTIEAIDDPEPGVDFISVASAISDAIDLVDVLLISREISGQ